MSQKLEDYAKKLDEEIIQLKDKHQNLKSRLSLLISTCSQIIEEGKREANSVVISEGSFTQLRQNIKAIKEDLETETDLDREKSD